MACVDLEPVLACDLWVPTCVRKRKTNTFDESIKFLYWLFLVVLDGFRSF